MPKTLSIIKQFSNIQYIGSIIFGQRINYTGVCFIYTRVSSFSFSSIRKKDPQSTTNSHSWGLFNESDTKFAQQKQTLLFNKDILSADISQFIYFALLLLQSKVHTTVRFQIFAVKTMMQSVYTAHCTVYTRLMDWYEK